MSFAAPIKRFSTGPKGEIVQKVYLFRNHLGLVTVTEPERATQFSTRRDAELAQMEAIKLVLALPRPAEWDDFKWPTIEALEVEEIPAPVPLVLNCPRCHRQHIDEGEWATKPHRKHLCAKCEHEWRPANIYTVGVKELPE